MNGIDFDEHLKPENKPTTVSPCVQRELPCYVKTLAELRKQFEHMAVSSMFSIERKTNGEYGGYRGQTFILWAGYWECAKNNGILVGDDANFLNMHT